MSNTDTVYVVTYYETEYWGTRFQSQKFVKSEAYYDEAKARASLKAWSVHSSQYGNVKELKVIK